MSKRVAEIIIHNWNNPPKIEVRGFPEQTIHVGEAVSVLLPAIYIKNRKMPTLIIDLEVRRQQDVGQLRDIYYLVASQLEEYKDFWLRRKTEAEAGIFLQ